MFNNSILRNVLLTGNIQFKLCVRAAAQIHCTNKQIPYKRCKQIDARLGTWKMQCDRSSIRTNNSIFSGPIWWHQCDLSQNRCAKCERHSCPLVCCGRKCANGAASSAGNYRKLPDFTHPIRLSIITSAFRNGHSENRRAIEPDALHGIPNKLHALHGSPCYIFIIYCANKIRVRKTRCQEEPNAIPQSSIKCIEIRNF